MKINGRWTSGAATASGPPPGRAPVRPPAAPSGAPSATALRDGSRDGTRTGTVNGTIASDVAADARKTGQWTGWNLKGLTASPFAATGFEQFGQPTFDQWVLPEEWTFGDWESYGNWSPSGDYAFGDYTYGATTVWGPWDTDGDKNADPDTCFQNSNNLVPGSFQDVIAYGDVHQGAVEDGAVVPSGPVVAGDVVPVGDPAAVGDPTFGATTYGDVTATGSLVMYVNNKVLPITPVVVPAA